MLEIYLMVPNHLLNKIQICFHLNHTTYIRIIQNSYFLKDLLCSSQRKLQNLLGDMAIIQVTSSNSQRFLVNKTELSQGFLFIRNQYMNCRRTISLNIHVFMFCSCFLLNLFGLLVSTFVFLPDLPFLSIHFLTFLNFKWQPLKKKKIQSFPGKILFCFMYFHNK